MALYSCPNCGKSVSDTATKCVHCGVAFEEETQTCHECGVSFNIGATVCPNCGAPVLPKWKRKLRSRKAVIISIISAIVVLCTVFGAVRSYAYEKWLKSTTLSILENSAKAEDCVNLISAVWYNSIFKERDAKTDIYTRKQNGYREFYEDFNIALDNLFNDRQFQQRINYIRQNQEDTAAMMKRMKRPPLKWRNAYKVLLQYYESYLELSDLAINPSGSLQQYSESSAAADSRIGKYFDRLMLYFEGE